jgi:hypothetical protein
MYLPNKYHEVHKIALLNLMLSLDLISDNTYVSTTAGMDPLSEVEYAVNRAMYSMGGKAARMMFGAGPYEEE